MAGAAALAAAVLAGCGDSGNSDGGGGQGFIGGKAGSAGVDSYARGDRKAAPDLSGETLQGEKLKLADYRGSVVVLNVWGSWCPPCRAEAKHLEKVAKDTKAQGVRFLGINTRDLDPSNARAFERKYGVTYPSLYDPAGKLLARFHGSVPPQTIPTTLVLDREGKIAVRALKPLGEEDLREMLDPVIAEKA
ncbi:hypothetical protein GCM10027168_14310 [Streptomyces capparidis]